MRYKKDINIEIGRRIKNRRLALNISRETLSEQADISPGFLSCIENGVNGPSIETLRTLAKLLGVSTDYLMRGADLTAVREDVLEAIKEIPNEDMEQLLKTINLFKEQSKFFRQEK